MNFKNYYYINKNNIIERLDNENESAINEDEIYDEKLNNNNYFVTYIVIIIL